MTLKKTLLVFWIATFPFFASAAKHSLLHESDIAGPASPRFTLSGPTLAADEVVTAPIEANHALFSVELLIKGTAVAIPSLQQSIVCQGANSVNYNRTLNEASLTVFVPTGTTYETYAITHIGQCGNHYRLRFKSESEAGQAIGIYRVAFAGIEKLKSSTGLDFLPKPVGFVFPSDGDYYDGTVNISKGFQWDVIAHEMGHAIYDAAGLGRRGGGSHYIDQCYNETLALSEGWASFYGAWVTLALNDPDAKFEYLVPRRAPIRIETIPADVCGGPRNEWRVTGFLWDLIDANQDNEVSQIEFALLFNGLRKARVSSIKAATQLWLKKNLITSSNAGQAWEQNFLEKLVVSK